MVSSWSLDDFSRINIPYGLCPILLIKYTPGETENECQKTKQVPILLLKGAKSFFDAKKMKKIFLLTWTSKIIQFIRYPIQMDRTERSNFFGGKG